MADQPSFKKSIVPLRNNKLTGPPLTPASLATSASLAMSLLQKFQTCAEVAEQVIAMTRDEMGNIVLPNLALGGAKSLRETLLAVTKIMQHITDLTALDELNEAIISKIMERDPELAMEVIQRIQEVTDSWAKK